MADDPKLKKAIDDYWVNCAQEPQLISPHHPRWRHSPANKNKPLQQVVDEEREYQRGRPT